jgi:hypothetical protein
MGETKEVKEAKILAFLQTGNRITGYQATIKFGYTNMAKYACKLIDRGFPIKREWIAGGGCKEYYLEEIAA